MTGREARTVCVLAAMFAIGQPAGMAYGGQAPSASTPTPAAEQDSIGIETFSWGKLISKWKVYPDGSGELAMVPKGSRPLVDYKIVTRRFTAKQTLYQSLSELLKPAERYFDKELPCKNVITDMPYGEIKWWRSDAQHALKFNYGCQSAKAVAIYKAMNAASNLVDDAAKDAPVQDETTP